MIGSGGSPRIPLLLEGAELEAGVLEGLVGCGLETVVSVGPEFEADPLELL